MRREDVLNGLRDAGSTKILDCHNHIGISFNNYVATSSYPYSMSIEDLLVRMDFLGIDHSVVFPFEKTYKPQQGEKERLNSPPLTTFTYDKKNRLITRINGDNKGVHYTRNSSGRVEQRTNGMGNINNYYYDENELGEIKKRLDKLAGAFETLTVIANNHYRGAELANALELKALVTGEKQLVPEGLLRSYPDLARIALDA